VLLSTYVYAGFEVFTAVKMNYPEDLVLYLPMVLQSGLFSLGFLTKILIHRCK